jgi:hypothetical protein
MANSKKALKDAAKLHLREQLERARRSKNPVNPGNQDPRLKVLQSWQQQRLADDYADLRTQPRFRAACNFFINDLYGPQDFSQRDADVERIYPIMCRLLPAAVLDTVTLAVELDALSHELDVATALMLEPGQPVSMASYRAAYIAGTTAEQRRHQIVLLLVLGRELDRLVRKPMLWDLLRMCRWPARLAGLSALQSFLERGFDAFRQLKGAGPFLRTIAAREKRFARELRIGLPDAPGLLDQTLAA